MKTWVKSWEHRCLTLISPPRTRLSSPNTQPIDSCIIVQLLVARKGRWRHRKPPNIIVRLLCSQKRWHSGIQQSTYMSRTSLSSSWWASKRYEPSIRLTNWWFIPFLGWRWSGWRTGGVALVNSRAFPLIAPSIPCPNRRICGARRHSNASQTFYRCYTKVRRGRCAIWGDSGHGRPANPSIEGGGGRFSTILAILDVRLKPRAGLRPNPCSGA
jgi:hypothetical protein